jgi:hypothetical protein
VAGWTERLHWPTRRRRGELFQPPKPRTKARHTPLYAAPYKPSSGELRLLNYPQWKRFCQRTCAQKGQEMRVGALARILPEVRIVGAALLLLTSTELADATQSTSPSRLTSVWRLVPRFRPGTITNTTGADITFANFDARFNAVTQTLSPQNGDTFAGAGDAFNRERHISRSRGR